MKQSMSIKQSLNIWWVTMLLLSILSILLPILCVIMIILLIVARKMIMSAAEKADKVVDVEAYDTTKRAEADTYCSQIRESADSYYNQQKEAADTYYQTQTFRANQQKKELEESADALRKELEEKNAALEKELEAKISALKEEEEALRQEVQALSSEDIIVAANFEVDESITSEEYKSKLTLLKIKLSDLVKNDKALVIDSQGSKKVIRDNSKQILRCFEAESSSIVRAVTTKNIDTQRNKLHKSFESLNKIFEVDGIKLTSKILKYKLEELNLTYAYQLKKEQEKEEQKAIREQMLEEEKVRREIEREKAKIEKEENQFKNEITKLMKYLQKASEVEKQLYIDKINELEAKLKLVEKDKENVLEREQNTRAGYVYVISNIGSFGEDVYKIGMTRRLEPMDRVKELGDASVPFEFDVHAMIFSEDAPTLETTLHNTFKANQVNKVNPRKEFFKVSLAEIESVVKANHNATVTFTQIAKAEQYRESLRLAEMVG